MPYKRKEVIGECTLYLGDCMEVVPQISFDTLVSDVPYGMAYKSGYATDALWTAGRAITGDASTVARDSLLSILPESMPKLVFGTWRVPRPSSTKMVLVWDKGGALGMGDLSIPWKPDHEEIYVLGKGFAGTRDSGSVLRHPPVQSMAKNGRKHPTEKPVGLMKMLLVKTNGRVCDPFMGSGSTGVACAQIGRTFYGVEIEERYFDIACRRIEEAYKQPDMFVAPSAAPQAKQESLI